MWLSHTKEQRFVICSSVDGLEGIMRSETSRTEKDQYCTASLTCEIKKTQQMRDYNKKEALTDTESKLEAASGEEGTTWRQGSGTHKLLSVGHPAKAHEATCGTMQGI